MNSKRLYISLLAGCVMLVLALLASVYLGTSFLQGKASELADAKVKREVVDVQELSLLQARTDIEEYSELEELASRIIPQEKDQARTVREIISLAEQSGITVSAISFPTSSLGTNQPKTAAEPEESSAPTAPAITQATPVPGLSGLFELELNVQVSESNSYGRFISFLERLEQNRRTSQVQSVSIVPDANDRNQLTFNVNLVVYIKP